MVESELPHQLIRVSMSHRFFHVLVIIHVLNLSSAISMQPVQERTSSSRFIFHFENDVFVKTDRQYSHSFGLTWMSPDNKSDTSSPRWSRPFFLLPSVLERASTYRNFTVALRQDLYTPNDLRQKALIPDDRPYAGVTTIALGFHEKSDRGISTFVLNLGIVGPHSYAEVTQKKLHCWIDSPYPQGWHNQLKDEAIVNLNVQRRWRATSSGTHTSFGIDVHPSLRGGLGNMKTYAGAGAQVRLGWNLPHTYGTYMFEPNGECEVPISMNDPVPSWGFHFHVALEGQAVLHDIFLDGNTFQDSHRVDKHPFTGHLICGFGFDWHRLRLNYAFVFQTKQFKTQKQVHVYGGMTLSVSL